MKKLFTLLAAAAVALTMNAQMVYEGGFEDWNTGIVGGVWDQFEAKGVAPAGEGFWFNCFSFPSLDNSRNHKYEVVNDANTGTKALSVTINTADATADKASVGTRIRTGADYPNGNIYELSFSAKASIATGATISGNDEDWLDVTTTYQDYTQRDTIIADGNGRIVIVFGDVIGTANVTYTVDDIYIEKVGVVSISDNEADAFSIYDNADKVEVYNLAGVKVAKASNTTIANIELNSGIYIAVVTKNGQTAKIKFVK
jgi:hypothetical protein